MITGSPEENDLTAAEFSDALRKLQEGEQTADEIEHKLDLMEQKMAVLLEQVDQMQSSSNSNQIQETSYDKK